MEQAAVWWRRRLLNEIPVQRLWFPSYVENETE
jgi:hypothetical protein